MVTSGKKMYSSSWAVEQNISNEASKKSEEQPCKDHFFTLCLDLAGAQKQQHGLFFSRLVENDLCLQEGTRSIGGAFKKRVS